jgi:hypothetical protein
MGYNLFNYRSVTQEGTAVMQESVCFKCMDFEEKYNELREDNIALQKKVLLSQNMYECTLKRPKRLKRRSINVQE